MTNPSIHIRRRGFMLVISSPSGAGKTTVSRKLLAQETDLEMSVSVTTRPARPGEEDGKDYYFIDEGAFQGMVKSGLLLEHALVYGHHYATPKASIEKKLNQGIDILFDIDWQGTQQMKEISTGDIVSIFILPPSSQALEERLRSRGQDSEEIVHARMKKAADEISHWSEYDYIIINNQVDETVEQVSSILHAERLKRRRRVGLAEFVNFLRGEN
ncbi:Guanylate kinase [Candidatus Bealeia paramacronuclearis]|uniref:Guanylate kinase n=1 Tax=Candidatus Bealeia paramacronuclearis TaxID=1921001 RepID=A0ABZ2C4J7_9PROT|nr:Guanylate kinase [Candidatus Bealeia paramacronuclearis]